MRTLLTGSQSGQSINAEVTWKKIEQEYSFLDYLQHGMQINAIVSIDFTGSNGIPTHPQSLHYLQPQFFNQYENAIQSVGTIIQVKNVFFSYFLMNSFRITIRTSYFLFMASVLNCPQAKFLTCFRAIFNPTTLSSHMLMEFWESIEIVFLKSSCTARQILLQLYVRVLVWPSNRQMAQIISFC